ncbi:MAG: DUF4365 domain-containing protein [Candidatus Omnitrophica bacterium]|nr:DUF4365 domain-containing protein [Candidatus Omnitrophota bacterium]
MTIEKSFEIEEEAKSIFTDTLPLTWLKRKQTPDFYVDYFVEVDKEREPSGVVFGVQLKGTRKLSTTKKHVKFSMKVKHLKYYFDNARQPIFLVVIDVVHRKGYWVFIQQYIKEVLNLSNWRELIKTTIKIPIQNLLNDIDSFHEAIHNSEKYMRELRPSSVHSAAMALQKEWNSLEPRSKVDVSYKDSTTNVNVVMPEENQSFIFTRHGDSEILLKKYTDLMERGRRVQFKKDEIELFGSPLLEMIKKKFSRFELEISNRSEGEVFISAIDSGGNEIGPQYRVDGEIVYARKEIRFECTKKSLPLKINLIFSFEDRDHLKEENMVANVEYFFNDDVWENKPIRQIQYFDALNFIFKSVKNSNKVKFVFESEGKSLTMGYASMLLNEDAFNYFVGYFDLIEKIQFITKSLDINPKYRAKYDYSKTEVQGIYATYSLIKKGEIQIDATSITPKISIPNEGLVEFEKTGHKKGEAAKIDSSEFPFKLFGERVDLGPVRYIYTNADVIVTKQEENNFLKIQGIEGTKLIIQRIFD